MATMKPRRTYKHDGNSRKMKLFKIYIQNLNEGK